MIFLKQSTAVAVSFGPFVDPTDGVTLETGLVSAIDHGTTGIFLSKNGGALTIRHATVTASTYDAYGNYIVTLDTTDTNTLGTLRMQFAAAASCVPVWQDFMVLPANVYDSLVSGSDVLDVSATQFAGQTITAAAGVTLPSSVASPTNITGGTITTVTNLTNAPTNGDLTAAMKGSVNAEVVDVLRTDLIPDSVAADGVLPTLTQAIYEMLQFLTEKAVVGTTLTVNKVNGSTALMTFTLDDASNPTAITRTT